MAFTAKDGSRFTNHSTMKQHEARMGAKAPMMKMGGAAAMGGGADDTAMEDGEGDPMDGAAMAEQHGAATEMQMHHDHEAGKHSVHAMHPDGHEHDTEHASADAAHKFAMDCAGCGGDGAMSGMPEMGGGGMGDE